MKLYPFDACMEQAKDARDVGADVYQQFNCAHCGTKQTMEIANVFYETGRCEECRKVTNIKADGCNFMVHLEGRNLP